MAEVKVVEMDRWELAHEKRRLDNHIAACCGARDGTCRELMRLGEIEYLLGKETSNDVQ